MNELKKKTQLYDDYKDHFSFKNTDRLKVKEWKLFLANSNQKRTEVAICVADKTEFK